MTADDGEHEAKPKEKSSRPLRDLREHIAGTCAEQRIRRTTAESHARAGFLFRQL